LAVWRLRGSGTVPLVSGLDQVIVSERKRIKTLKQPVTEYFTTWILGRNIPLTLNETTFHLFKMANLRKKVQLQALIASSKSHRKH